MKKKLEYALRFRLDYIIKRLMIERCVNRALVNVINPFHQSWDQAHPIDQAKWSLDRRWLEMMYKDNQEEKVFWAKGLIWHRIGFERTFMLVRLESYRYWSLTVCVRLLTREDEMKFKDGQDVRHEEVNVMWRARLETKESDKLGEKISLLWRMSWKINSFSATISVQGDWYDWSELWSTIERVTSVREYLRPRSLQPIWLHILAPHLSRSRTEADVLIFSHRALV